MTLVVSVMTSLTAIAGAWVMQRGKVSSSLMEEKEKIWDLRHKAISERCAVIEAERDGCRKEYRDVCDRLTRAEERFGTATIIATKELAATHERLIEALLRAQAAAEE